MDMAAVMKEVDGWPVDAQLGLVEHLWNRLVDSGKTPDLTEAQKTELDSRLADAESDPEVVSWETVRAKLQRRR